MHSTLQLLAADWRALAPTDGVLFVTGAGVSLASGVPTFRGTDPDAVWAKDTTTLGTNEYFQRDPVGSWRWYLSRFSGLDAIRPNAGHTAIVELDALHTARGGAFLLVTQNIDGLPRDAGSERLVEVHGRADRVRCSRQGCQRGAPYGSMPRADFDFAKFLGAPGKDTLPRCPSCSAFVRPHVLWFDEYYSMHEDYGFDRAMDAATTAKLVVFVGTSFAVGITELVLEEARRRAKVYSIDPTPRAPAPFVQSIAAKSEEALPALVDALRAG